MGNDWTMYLSGAILGVPYAWVVLRQRMFRGGLVERRECNKRTVVNLERRSSYTSELQALNDIRNDAVLRILAASASGDINQARMVFLDGLKKYQEAEARQKIVIKERNKVKLPKLDDCL